MEYADFKIPVETADGHKIGVLAGVDGPYMRVGRGWWRRDYWIPTEYIANATPRNVILAFSECSVNRYARVHRPVRPEAEVARQGAAGFATRG
jgi:hypothetical protein